MALTASLALLINRLYPHVTVDAGAHLVSIPPTGSAAQLRGRHVTVVSFRPDGSPVATPVWFAVVDGEVVFRSLARAHKVHRMIRDPRVLIAPCSPRGRPTGAPSRGRATVLEGAAAGVAEDALRRRYSLGRRAYRAATSDADAVYFSVALLSAEEAEGRLTTPSAPYEARG